MSICGKGNLPECQFFTTGGCVSPFNCIYKIKLDFHTGATSNATEISRNTEIARLTAENAKLRARLEKAVELPAKIGDTIYTVIKNCTLCQHYNAGWAQCRAPATANFDCKSTHGTCFTQDIIDDECEKHLCVAKLEFDLRLLDDKTGELNPQYFIDREAAETRLKKIKEEKNND